MTLVPLCAKLASVGAVCEGLPPVPRFSPAALLRNHSCKPCELRIAHRMGREDYPVLCPLCSKRRVKRACPALGRQICAVCCGSKRLVEISCSADCTYLLSARAHPPAKTQRQRERDGRFFAALLHSLTDPQFRLFLALHGAIKSHRSTAIPVIIDDDVAEACSALASTFETAGRGIIYDHHATSLAAGRLATKLKTLLEDLASKARLPLERDAASALRQIEQGARRARSVLDGDKTAYLDFVDRMLQQAAADTADVSSGETISDTDSAPKLIVPGV